MIETIYQLQPTPATSLRKGDRVLIEDHGVFTLADKPLRLRGRGVDQQWVTLRFVEDVPDAEVHEGDRFDKVVAEVNEVRGPADLSTVEQLSDAEIDYEIAALEHAGRPLTSDERAYGRALVTEKNLR